jgi:hypothetical protein
MYLPNLNKLMGYCNSKVISRYCHDYPNAKIKDEEALRELMKFIWLCLKHKLDIMRHPKSKFLNFSCVIHPEMEDIDNMWHTFLLFTKDYQTFCDFHLDGNFFHHEPIVQSHGDMIDDKQYQEELTMYLNYIYDNLGKDTLIKWFNSLL